ncbi:MAG: hypothetical protein MJ233_04955 [Mycoplasmoidaceae bacterium]|nr:hypothetical protein [Mycoplasmoidaceae bacterium]
MKMSKKAIAIISGSSAAIIAGTTIAANLLIQNESGQSDQPDSPSHPSKNDHYYPIIKQLKDNEKWSNLIDIVRDGRSITYIINEDKFVANIINIVRETLDKILTFKDRYYKIEVTYKTNTKSILVDLV